MAAHALQAVSLAGDELRSMPAGPASSLTPAEGLALLPRSAAALLPRTVAKTIVRLNGESTRQIIEELREHNATSKPGLIVLWVSHGLVLLVLVATALFLCLHRARGREIRELTVAPPAKVASALVESAPATAPGKAGSSSYSASVLLPAPEPAPAPKRTARLGFLDGSRFLFAWWVVLYHMYGSCCTNTKRNHSLPVSTFMDWAGSGVSYFIVLSGFVTQYTQRALVARLSRAGIGWYYAKRLSRVLLLTWTSMALSICLKESERFNFEKNPGRIFSCFTLTTNLFAPGAGACPNSPTWTVMALAMSWLLFPASQWLLAKLDAAGGTPTLLTLALAIGTSSIVRFLLLDDMEWGTYIQRWDYFWSGAQQADFVLGMIVATVVRKHEDVHPQLWHVRWLGRYSVRGALADTMAVAYITLCVRYDPLNNQAYLGHYEYLTGHMAAIFFALFLYGSSAGSCAGVVARVLSNPALVALGEYAFAIYLLCVPWSWYGFNKLFAGNGDLFDSQTHQPLPKRDVLNLSSLIAVSVAWTELIEKPLVSGFLAWLKRALGDGTLK